MTFNLRLVTYRFYAALALLIALGVGLRLALVIASDWRIDYDEAMIGLLARRVLRGDFAAFIPAQATLGAVEPVALAPFFALFGADSIAFRLYSLLCGAAYVGVTGLLTRAAYSPRTGLIAALLAAIAPPYMLVTGIKTWGATIETMILGAALLLLAACWIKAERERQRRRIAFAAGLTAGVMFWAAWLGFYYFIPAAIALLAWGRLRQTWPALIGFALGSVPFWLHNMTHGFPTFESALSASRPPLDQLADVVDHFARDLFPRLVTGDPAWGGESRPARWLLTLVYGAGLIALITAGARSVRSSRPSPLRALLALFVVAVPLIYLFSSYSANALNPWGIDATGRYVLMLHTALPVGVALLAEGIMMALRRSVLAKLAAAGLIALICGLNLIHTARLDPLRAFDSPYYDRLPETLDPLIDFLDARGIDRVWTDVGLAQVLTFETGERIIAADYYDAYVAGGPIRFPDALAAVAAADETAFVVPTLPDQTDMPITRALAAAEIAYEIVHVTPTLAVILPAEHLDPAHIAAGLGYQY